MKILISGHDYLLGYLGKKAKILKPLMISKSSAVNLAIGESLKKSLKTSQSMLILLS